MITLGADARTMTTYRPLTKDDIKASTAILDPNFAGSTRLQLSWIWRNLHYFDAGGVADSGGTDAATMLECKFISHTQFWVFSSPSVKRIHWLRARAKSGRWAEEVRLVTYEMQWTVRYFLHQADHWEKAAAVSPDNREASAFAYRQRSIWFQLVSVADGVFAATNTSYQSPIV